ncbi:MAG: GTP 3',8-cyclase MoaA [Thermodesulfobacteriota bacterium]
MVRQLVDLHQRAIRYLRVSITDLCNLRCVYCRPPEGVKLVTHDDILRYEEILTIIEIARDLGITKVRITGGEPLVRRGVVQFMERLLSMPGIEDVGLTTNGTRLAAMVAQLRTIGLRRVNISLDTLRREVFAQITGSDALDTVLEGISAALGAGFNPVKINVVLLKGINEGDIPGFAKMTLDTPVDVRFIERMPFGPGEALNPPNPFSAAYALDMIREAFGSLEEVDRDSLAGPARMFRIRGAQGRIGVIEPVTGHFCGTCNRMRLTAKGTLRPCLMSSREIDIKKVLRSGASREQVAEVLRFAVRAKPAGSHSDHCLEPQEGMNRIGG